TDGRSRRSLALSTLPAGSDVVPARPPQRPRLHQAPFPCRPLFPRPTARCGRPHRLSRLSLVARPPRSPSQHPTLLLFAAPALGLGRLAGEEDASLGGPRPLHPAVRGKVVSGTWHPGTLHR